MKNIKLAFHRHDPKAPFRIKRLGSHEEMQPGMVDRPKGTRDFLIMLFHTEVLVKTVDNERCLPPSSLFVWTPQDGHHYGNAGRSWDHSWFHCSGSEIDTILKANHIPFRQGITLSDPSLMDHFLLEVIAELSGWSQPNGTILRNLFENFILALARQTRRKGGQLVPASLLAPTSNSTSPSASASATWLGGQVGLNRISAPNFGGISAFPSSNTPCNSE